MSTTSGDDGPSFFARYINGNATSLASIDRCHDCDHIDIDGRALFEVLVWSLTYAIVRAAPVGTDLTYFAFVNYTTLGYGDVRPVERWNLLGPMTAMNGVPLFGWSTAAIFEVLRRTLTAALSEDGHSNAV